MWSARLKLGSLLLSQAARVGADVALGLEIAFRWARRPEPWEVGWISAWLLFWPPIVLAPLIGQLCDYLHKSRVLVHAVSCGLVTLAVYLLMDKDPLWCWGLIAIRAAFYAVAQSAMWPAASLDANVSLPRVNALFLAAAWVAGCVLFCPRLHSYSWRPEALADWLAWPGRLSFILNAVAFAFALPASFGSDCCSPRKPLVDQRRFLAGCVGILRDREIRSCLLLIAAFPGLLVALVLGDDVLPYFVTEWGAAYVLGGLACGALLTCVQAHPRRLLSLVPVGATGLAASLAWWSWDIRPSLVFAFVGIFAGLALVPVWTQYQIRLPANLRGTGMALCNQMAWLGIAGGFILSFLHPSMLRWVLISTTAVGALYSWWIFRREVVEQLIEFVFAIMYRFRATGPGVTQCPVRGPVLVIANHSNWFDPMWLAKVLPRSLFPMMTSAYYDRPLFRWSMVHLFEAIRVEESRFRREVPELKEAVAALDDGKCLVVFPEGELRKRAERPLKRFGQGVWHILRERPETPVLVCWIEGGWGGYFSYFNGPPTRNKPLDFRRPITFAVAAPQVLPPEVLADQMQTRQYLMQECLRMRASLGLEPVTLEQPEPQESIPAPEQAPPLGQNAE